MMLLLILGHCYISSYKVYQDRYGMRNYHVVGMQQMQILIIRVVDLDVQLGEHVFWQSFCVIYDSSCDMNNMIIGTNFGKKAGPIS